jgi:hypothetical protein
LRCLSGHVGGALLIGRNRTTVGPRAEVELGIRGLGGAAGLVVIPLRATIPLFGIELNARYLRPWSVNADRREKSGPELGLDFLSLRFTVTALGKKIAAPMSERQFVFGFGFGYL